MPFRHIKLYTIKWKIRQDTMRSFHSTMFHEQPPCRATRCVSAQGPCCPQGSWTSLPGQFPVVAQKQKIAHLASLRVGL